MRFLSAWSCGIATAWAFVAWFDDSTIGLVFALTVVFITAWQSLHWAALAAQLPTPEDNETKIQAAVDKEINAMIDRAPKAMRQVISALREAK